QITQGRRKKQAYQENDEGGEQTGQWSACATAFVDQRLRHATAHRKRVSQSSGQVGGRQAKKFLIWFEPAAVFGGKHSPDGRRLNSAQHEAGDRERQQLI